MQVRAGGSSSQLGGVDEFEPEPDGCQIDHAEEA
jgi:hypothetical protein